MALVLRKSDTVTPGAWCHLILNRCGLTFRDTQVPNVLGYVREQMRASGITNERRYYDQLAGEPEGGAEWSALVEHLLNHETSFFRHPPSFDALRTHILPELHDARGGRRLNFWSAGCSTGQEAYSMAMVAMDDDELGGDFTVWGGDISRQAIDIARRGRYGPRAIAGVPVDYRDRFVRSLNGGAEYEIADELQRRVRFAAINLVSACGVSLNYDVIFCHNVLIYLSPIAVSQVIAQLATRLALGGYLLLGPGEGPTERPAALEAVTFEGVRMLRRKCQTPAELRS